MADEIRNANVMTLEHQGGVWVARIGPVGLGLCELHRNPYQAAINLMIRAKINGWVLDPSYRRKPEPTYHDA